MMVIGVCLLIFFVVVVVFALQPTEKNTRPMRYKGPVEDPFKQGRNQWPGPGGLSFSVVADALSAKSLFVQCYSWIPESRLPEPLGPQKT
jgi:hypothetical protein